MRINLRSAATLAAAAAVALPVSLSPALAAGRPAAASAPGWHVVQTFGLSFGSPTLTGGLAVSATTAWVQGYTFSAGDSLFLARWNGATWSQVAGPRVVTSLSASVSPGPLAVSGSSLWTFPAAVAAHAKVYAARLASGHWTTWQLPGALRIDGAAVFGGSDAWAFGEAVLPPGWPGLQNGPSYAEHFDGSNWRRVALPGVPLIVQALSKDNIWAYGPTNKTASAANQSFVAMHWNGHRWSTLAIPRIRATNGKLMWPASLAVQKDGSLWVTEDFHCPVPGSCDPSQPPGIILARWNGRSWARVLDSAAYEVPGAEPDGHGGLWIEALTATKPRSVFLHYTAGRLTALFPPTASGGAPANVTAPIPIPGTRSAWSTGDAQHSNGPSLATVYKYSP